MMLRILGTRILCLACIPVCRAIGVLGEQLGSGHPSGGVIFSELALLSREFAQTLSEVTNASMLRLGNAPFCEDYNKTLSSFQNFDAVVVSWYDWSCFPGNADELCEHIATVILEVPDAPGYLFNVVDDRGSTGNMSCIVLEAWYAEPRRETRKTLWRNTSKSYLVSLTIDNTFQGIVGSVPMVLYSRAVLPVLFLYVAFDALYILWLRKSRHGRIQKLILVVNMCQGFVLATLNIMGCIHYGPGNCARWVHEAVWGEFLGLSLFTDIVFADMLREFVFSLTTFGRSNSSCKHIIRLGTLAIGCTIGLMDVIFLLLFTFTDWVWVMDFVMGVLPFVAIILQVLVLVQMLVTTRELIRVLESCVSNSEPGEMSNFNRLQLVTAKNFKHYSQVSIVSAIGVILSSLLYTTGTTTTNVVVFIFHVGLLDVSKFLNLLCQTNVHKPHAEQTSRVSVLPYTVHPGGVLGKPANISKISRVAASTGLENPPEQKINIEQT